MTLTTSARQPHHTVARRIVRVVCVAVLALVTLAGCGSSSKPAYCSARTSLENSINEATGLSPTSQISALEAAFTKVKADADTVVIQAKSDFPNESSAIKSSVAALTSAVNALKANPSPSRIATVASAAANVVRSFTSFVAASKSKCS
ncbi:MAG: hypothetical protein WBQ18_00695 [Solirubrobacteraceae bacterium]